MQNQENAKLMAQNNLPPVGGIQQPLSMNNGSSDIQELQGEQIENLLQNVDYLDIEHIRDTCCYHQAHYKNREHGIDLKLVKNKKCFCCTDRYNMYYHHQEIAHAKHGHCCNCCGSSWNLELNKGSSLKSEQKVPGIVHQHKGAGIMPCHPKAFQREYTIQSKFDGYYCCSLCCTTLFECCALKKRPKCCPMKCMQKGGGCEGLCCLCVWMCCPGKGKERCKCCPCACMYGDGSCACCCYCCVRACCPVTLTGAHNYIKRKRNFPWCCIFTEYHLEFDPNMTAMDKYTCVLQTAVNY